MGFADFLTKKQLPDIVDLRKRGFSDTQIIASLQKKGYSARDISDAMKQLDQDNTTAGENMDSQNYEEEFKPIETAPPMQNQDQGYMQDPAVQQGVGREQIEEITEALIEEKWKELINEWDKLIAWKEQSEQRLAQIEQKFIDLKDGFDKLHTAVLERVSGYDRNITDVGTELKALEKVFQKVLPTFTENVNELSRVSADLKKLRK